MAINGHAVHGSLPAGHFLFTSESVGEGHPGIYFSSSRRQAKLTCGLDKICDQVSDAIVGLVALIPSERLICLLS